MKKILLGIICLFLFFTAISVFNYSVPDTTISDAVLICSVVLGWFVFWIIAISFCQYLAFKIKGNKTVWQNVREKLYWSNVCSVIVISPLSLIGGFFIYYGIFDGCIDRCISYEDYFLWGFAAFLVSCLYTFLRQKSILAEQKAFSSKWLSIVLGLIVNLMMYETLATIMFIDKI